MLALAGFCNDVSDRSVVSEPPESDIPSSASLGSVSLLDEHFNKTDDPSAASGKPSASADKLYNERIVNITNTPTSNTINVNKTNFTSNLSNNDNVNSCLNSADQISASTNMGPLSNCSGGATANETSTIIVTSNVNAQTMSTKP